MELASEEWLELKKKCQQPDYNDGPRSLHDMFNSEPTAMERAYHPKNNPHQLPELASLPDGYPASRTADDAAKYNAARFDPHRFAECRFSPSVGLVVTVKTCAMPCVITEKMTVKLEPGLPCRGDVQSVKHLKLQPLASFDLLPAASSEREHVPQELEEGDWVLSTNCAPLDLHFDFYYSMFEHEPQMRIVYLNALLCQKSALPCRPCPCPRQADSPSRLPKHSPPHAARRARIPCARLRAFYPELTLVEYYHKLRPRNGERAPVPPEIR